MPTPAEKLADVLEKMHAVQVDGIVRSENLTRASLTRLVRAGFLQEIIRGWYFVTNPATSVGATAWYGHYWNFLAQYIPSASEKITACSRNLPCACSPVLQ